MRTEEHWTWMLRIDGGRRHRSRFKMTEAMALAYDPEAERCVGTAETRQIAETDDERSLRTNSKPGDGRR